MMKNKKILSLLIICLLVIGSPHFLNAQDTRTLVFSPESSITVDGTSNRDDWTVTAEQFDGHVTLSDADQAAPDIEEARLVVAVQEMAGGTSSIMDRLMRNALKAAQHPEIVYEFISMETEAGSGDEFSSTVTGNLTLAGVTQTIEVDLQGTKLENGMYQFKGSHSLIMPDYDIAPPTALFGALVTGEEVTVNFDLITNGE